MENSAPVTAEPRDYHLETSEGEVTEEMTANELAAYLDRHYPGWVMDPFVGVANDEADGPIPVETHEVMVGEIGLALAVCTSVMKIKEEEDCA